MRVDAPALNAKSSTLIPIVFSVLLLILVDQATKTAAHFFTPAALESMGDRSLALAWHIHQPNAYSDLLALVAVGLVAFAWTLPIPTFVKVMWTAAGVSNHLEMVMRPGTMDFLAFRLFDRVWVANVADIYFVVGCAVLLVTMTKRVRAAKSWFEPC